MEIKETRQPKAQSSLDRQQHEAFPCLVFELITITVLPTRWRGRWLD